jgi:hypothetical protein
MNVTDEIRESRRRTTAAHYAAHPERRQADRNRMKKFCAENPEWCKEQGEKLQAAFAAKQKAKKEEGGTQ